MIKQENGPVAASPFMKRMGEIQMFQKQIIRRVSGVAAIAAALVLAPTAAHAGGHKGGDYVSSFQPVFSVTCDGASFSHPAFKGGFGVPASYLLYVGSSQAEAQSSAPIEYTPGSTYEVVFDDRYSASSIYFELKAEYDGLTFQHKLGERKGVSEPCERPIPEQPADEVFVSAWSDRLECEARTFTSTRFSETTPFVWDAEAWSWVAGETVTTDEVVTRDATVEECPLPVEEPDEVVTPVTPGQGVGEAQQTLPVTGPESFLPLAGLGALLLGAGVWVMRRAVRS